MNNINSYRDSEMEWTDDYPTDVWDTVLHGAQILAGAVCVCIVLGAVVAWAWRLAA